MSHILSIRGIGQPIAYFPKLSKYLGCVNAGIFLGQMVFWSDKTDNPLGVYKTSEEITEETGLSYKQQVSARKKLVSLGLISETYKRLDHRLFFKFNAKRFDEWFSEVIFAEEQKVNSPNAETEFPELPKGHFGNTPKVCSGTDHIVDREQPKGQIVIQENTTKNTTEINTQENSPENSVDEVLNLWVPDLHSLNSWLQRSGEQAMTQDQVDQIRLEVNSHYSPRLKTGSVNDTQMYSNFVKWIKRKPTAKKSTPPDYKKSKSMNRNVNDAWKDQPKYQGPVLHADIPEDYL